MVVGMPTSHSAEPLNKEVNADFAFVWNQKDGTIKGQSIKPIYKTAPQAAKKDKKLYRLLSLTDALRAGNSRKKKLARIFLKKEFLNE